MTELMNAKRILTDYWLEQEKISNEYKVDNAEYCNGLYDAIRILENIINKEIEKEAEYYGEDKATEE